VPATPVTIARRALADHLAARPAAELLARYARERDPDAFAGLVQQFGPLVLGVCRRVLGPSGDADDAFQAVFLALARRANAFRDAQALPAWLHRVALRTARKVRTRRAAPRPPGTREPTDPCDPFASVAWKDVRRVLDEELDALPEKVRGAVVLCWLDGLTQDEAAARLGTSLNTLKRRLETGRTLLRSRLARRGLAPVLIATAALAPDGLRADVPGALATATADAALSANVIRSGWPHLFAFSAVIVAVACGLTVVCAGNAPPEPAPPPRTARPLDRPDTRAELPLPPGAVARFGSTHFRVPDRINATALSPDGTRVALADESQIRIYDATTWRLLRALPIEGNGGAWMSGHTLVFSPDGAHLAYTKNGQYAFAWEWKVGKRTHRFDSGDPWGWMSFCGFTPDGLLVLSDKEKLRFFDPATGTEKRAVDAPHVIALSPDGAHFIRHTSRTEPVPLVFGDAVTGKDLHKFDTAVGWSPNASFSPDGKRLALVPESRAAVEVWDVAKRTLVKRLPARAADRPAGFIGAGGGLTPDGSEVWLQQPDGDILRWDATTFRALPDVAAGRAMPPRALIPLPDGRTVLAPCVMGWVRIFDRHTGTERVVAERYPYPTTFALSSDGESVAAGDPSGRIDLLDPATGKLVRRLRETGDPVRRLVFGPDGALLGVGEGTNEGAAEKRRGAVRALWVADGKEMWARQKEKDARLVWPLGFTTEDRPVVAHDPNHGGVWDTRTGTEVRRFNNKNAQAAVSPDGKLLATDEHGEVVLIDLTTGREVRRVEVDPEERTQKRVVGSARFAWAGAGRVLATTLPGDRVCLLDATSGKELNRFPVHSGGGDDAFKRLEWRNGGHTVWALALAPDGKRLLASALGGWYVAIWDVRTGEQLAKLENGFPVDGAAFAPDGKSAFTFGDTGLGYRWDVEALIAAQAPKK